MNDARTDEWPAAGVPFFRLLAMSAAGAAIWALLGAVRGVTIGEYIALFAGGAVSLLLVQMTIDALKTLGSFPPRLFAVCGLSLVPIALAGHWLILNTHHRPLGAVTLSAIALTALLGVAALLLPLRVSPKFAAIVALVSATAGLWPLLAGQFGFLPLADLVAGVLLSGLIALASRQRLAGFDSRVTAGAASAALLAAAVFSLIGDVGAAAAVKAPVLAGVVGLLR